MLPTTNPKRPITLTNPKTNTISKNKIQSVSSQKIGLSPSRPKHGKLTFLGTFPKFQKLT
jgi:hypothetical protein